MPYNFSYAPRFEKHLKTLTSKEKKLTKEKLKRLAKNPAHPSLRTKRIQGTDDMYESSINMDIRVIWHFADGVIIILADIGHHDVLKQY